MTDETHRRFRWTDWPALAIAGLSALLAILVVIYFATDSPTVTEAESQFSEFARGVDDVALTDSDGAALRWADLNGKPRLVFFGFTRCPEICPTTVAELSAAIDELGADAGDVEVDFVSVDPARDTPEHLVAYFSGFGPSEPSQAIGRRSTGSFTRSMRPTNMCPPVAVITP